MNKITKRGKVTILNDEIVSKEERDLTELENYLKSRDFSYFIPVLNRDGNKNNYRFIEDYSLSKNQKAQDIIKTMALLHNKTSYTKEVNQDTFKALYDEILGYLNYTLESYQNRLHDIEYVDFPSPSELLLLTNYFKIQDAINFSKRELEVWYGLVSTKTKERVALNHGNMRLSHAISNDKTYFINWEATSFDSPILDLIRFYDNEWENLEFSSILETYFKNCELTDEEKKLFFINISIPKIIELPDDEYEKTIMTRKIIDYIYKTEKLIGPYYTKEEKKQ